MLPLLVDKLGIPLSMAGMLDAIKNSPSLLNPFLGLMVDRVAMKYFVIFTPGMSCYMLGGELSRTLGPLIITGAITLWGFEGTWRLIPFGLAASLMLYFKLKDFEMDRDMEYSAVNSHDH
jgi:MFS transporter, FSR family, fosmidomycin resistance protein